MKNLFTILILIVSLGAGCVETSSNTDAKNETENPNDYSSENQNSAKERILADGEIGFTVNKKAFGDFTVKYVTSPKGAAYVGSFAETEDFYFYVSDPNVSVGRGSWLGDTVGYSQKEGTYYLQWSDGGFEEEIPNDLIVGEYEAVNGKALLIKGESATGPSSWPAE